MKTELSVMQPQRRSRSPKRRTRLDAVLPTAVEVLDRKREAMRVLRAIDALLLATSDDSGDIASQKTRRDEHVRASGADAVTATPGPGAYSLAGLIGHCMKFEGYSDRTRPTLPWRLATKDRTPGREVDTDCRSRSSRFRPTTPVVYVWIYCALVRRHQGLERTQRRARTVSSSRECSRPSSRPQQAEVAAHVPSRRSR